MRVTKSRRTSIARPVVRLSRRQSAEGLLRLLHDNDDPTATATLCEAIVAHPAANAAVLKAVVDLGAGSEVVLNVVATSGRTSEPLLERLARAPEASVRYHARFNLLTRRLARSRPTEVIAAVKRSRGMNRAALELYLAFHPCTAAVTLEFLSKRGLTDQAAAEAYRRLQLGSRKPSEHRRLPRVASASQKGRGHGCG